MNDAQRAAGRKFDKVIAQARETERQALRAIVRTDKATTDRYDKALAHLWALEADARKQGHAVRHPKCHRPQAYPCKSCGACSGCGRAACMCC